MKFVVLLSHISVKKIPRMVQITSFLLSGLKQEANLKVPEFQIVMLFHSRAEDCYLSGVLYQSIFCMWGDLIKGLKAFHLLGKIQFIAVGEDVNRNTMPNRAST